MRQRPLSVTILSLVLIATGAGGLLFHFADFRQRPLPSDAVWVALVRLLAILAGVYMLRGAGWARSLAMAWIAFHVIIGFFHSWFELGVHMLICALFAWLLFRPPASKYFALWILLSVGLLLQPVSFLNAASPDCITACMERSGCWSGRSVSDPASCRNMPELCAIQCKGKSDNAWGAIAYSKKDKISGWSFEHDDKATAERVALQYCARQGGAQCVLEASFNHSCGAVAADGAQVAWGTSATKLSAQQRALAECARSGAKNCAVEAAVCSLPNASSAPPGNPPPPRSTSWGAIAYSAKDMGAGYSQGKPDRATAEKEAMNLCAQRGKACALQTSFNKACGALAADRDFTGFSTSTDQRQAQTQAIEQCKKAGGTRCALHISFCSM